MYQRKRKRDPSTKHHQNKKIHHPNSIPTGSKPTYLRIVAAFRPTKEDSYLIRWTVVVNNINYPGNTYTPNAGIVTDRLLFNSVISTPNAEFLGIDLKDIYLQTLME